MAWRRYPAYRGSGVAWLGEVPEGWQIRKLRECGRIFGGLTPSMDELSYWGGSIPWITPKDMKRSVLDSSQMQVTEKALKETRLPIVPPNSVLLVVRGMILAKRVPIARTIVPATVNQDMKAIVPVDDIDPSFLVYLLESANKAFVPLIEEAGHGTKRLPTERWRQISFAFPAKEEQSVIVTYLDGETVRIDALLAKKERQMALLQEKRAALISRAVTKGLDASAPMKDSGIAWLGDVPAHWETLKLTRVASLHSGHTPSRLHPEYWENCTIPWISLGDVWQLRSGKMEYIEETKEKISELGLRNSAAELLPPGTVILSRTASVGFSGIMATSMATTQDYANWVCGPRILPEYLLQVLRCMKQEFERLMMGSTHQTIYMPDIEAFRIPLPPIEEQQEIVQNVRSLQQRSERLEDAIAESIRLAQEYRTALISAAVTGKIDVRGEVPA